MINITTYERATRNCNDYVTIGNVPYDEECTPNNPNDPAYGARQIKECGALARQLMRIYGDPPSGAKFAIMKNPHDFGVYYDLVIIFNLENEVATEYAFKCEDLPDKWDSEAREELHLDEQKTPSQRMMDFMGWENPYDGE